MAVELQKGGDFLSYFFVDELFDSEIVSALHIIYDSYFDIVGYPPVSVYEQSLDSAFALACSSDEAILFGDSEPSEPLPQASERNSGNRG